MDFNSVWYINAYCLEYDVTFLVHVAYRGFDFCKLIEVFFFTRVSTTHPVCVPAMTSSRGQKV